MLTHTRQMAVIASNKVCRKKKNSITYVRVDTGPILLPLRSCNNTFSIYKKTLQVFELLCIVALLRMI